MLSRIRATGWLAAVILLVVMSPSSAELSPCPNSPNCVSSLTTDSEHRIEPLAFSMPVGEALVRLKLVLVNEPRTSIVKEEGDYLHAEVRSFLFRFVDDVEFLFDADKQVIHVRSASRTGTGRSPTTTTRPPMPAATIRR